jgi:hypothetical protein
MALRVPIDFEPMDFRPLGVTDALDTFLGMHGIEFESAEFNKRYFVTCENQKFAFDLVHPELIEYLMSVPGIRLQLGGPFIMASKEGFFESKELRDIKQMLERFVEIIPDYVKQDRGFEPNWTSPFDLNQ